MKYLFAVILLVLFSFLSKQNLSYSVSFLDVGQGGSVLFQKENCQVLIDFGNYYKATYKLGTIMPSTDKNIEFAVLTHADLDHYGGLLNVSQRYSVNNLFVSVFGEVPLSLPGVKATTMLTPVTKTLCGAKFEFLWPLQDHPRASKNEASIVALLTFNSHTFLLTGDIGCQTEETLLQIYPELKIDVLQSGHHGSRYSNCLPFLDSLKPKFVVTQSGLDNSYNHPHPDFLKRLASTSATHLRTDSQGDIIFDVSKSQLQLIQNQLVLSKPWQARFRELKAL